MITISAAKTEGSAPPADRPAIAATALLFVTLGIILRLVYPNDIEYKADEIWTFEQVQQFGLPWPRTGMPTSMGSVNPGMSVWVFIALGRLFGADTPPELARLVALCACAALVGFMCFARFAIDGRDREPWYWAAALWAVNPLAIIFERKIWPPSMLPLPMIGLIAAWWFRRHMAGAFFWGLLAALMAQIHLGVVFLAAAMVCWTWWRDRGGVHWAGWFAGSILGSLPALPWFLEILTARDGPALHWRWPIASHFVRWVTQPFGFGVEYTLGKVHMLEFLSGPTVLGYPSYLMAAAHVGLVALLLVILTGAVRAAIAQSQFWSSPLIGGQDPTGTPIVAALWGYGTLMTLITMTGASSQRHYLIVVAPLMGLWAARVALASRHRVDQSGSRLLITVLCSLQVAVSASLLMYIHQTHVIHGEYGPTWQSQQTPANDANRQLPVRTPDADRNR